MIIYLIIFLVYLVVAIIIGKTMNIVSNDKLGFGRYLLLNLIFTPMLAGFFAVIEMLSYASNKNEQKEAIETKHLKLEGEQMYVEKGSRRIKIYESELEFYLDDGWTKVTLNDTQKQ